MACPYECTNQNMQSVTALIVSNKTTSSAHWMWGTSTSSCQLDGKQTHFIPMNRTSMEKYRGIIRPVDGETMVVCDIDSTLYHRSSGLEDHIRSILVEYLCTLVPTRAEAVALKKRYDRVYGLTVYGILTEQKDAAADFYEQHISSAIDYEKYLRKDGRLKSILDGLACRKICFTNADVTHARNVLHTLGLTECFEAVVTIDTHTPRFIHKPRRESYEFVSELFRVRDRKSVLFFDDNARNIDQAIVHGWTAYHVQGNCHIGDLISSAVRMLCVETGKLVKDDEEIEVRDGC